MKIFYAIRFSFYVISRLDLGIQNVSHVIPAQAGIQNIFLS